MRRLLFLVVLLSAFITATNYSYAQTSVSPSMTYTNSAAVDVDDPAVWIHPTDTSQSVIIGSDKSGNQLFVYSLTGTTLQRITGLSKPGNIDVTYNFPLAGKLVDLIGFNERDTNKILLYTINPSTRQLTKVDNGSINTAPNYGYCFYRSPVSDRFYGFITSENGVIEQYELTGTTAGTISGARRRNWDLGGQTEGCVADNEKAFVYFGEETKSLWKYGAEPTDSTTTRTAVATVGQNGVSDDIEGVTLYYTSNGNGYLIISSQGNSSFKIFDRNAPHTYRGDFKVTGTSSTDGIDVSNVALGSTFPSGMFIAHDGSRSLRAASWQSIASLHSLTVDTRYNPRGGSTSLPSPTFGPSATPTRTPTRTPTPSQQCPGKPMGDVNCNGIVDLSDLTTVLANFGKVSTTGDVNGDTFVNLTDLSTVLANFGKPVSGTNPTATPTRTPTPVSGGSTTFSFSLTGSQEVPPVSTSGHGDATVTIDTSANMLTYDLSYHQLSGVFTAAHFHGPANAGQNADILFTFPVGEPLDGTWHYPQSLEADILNGRIYINVHSTHFPNGEIRGQVRSGPTLTPTITPTRPPGPSPTVTPDPHHGGHGAIINECPGMENPLAVSRERWITKLEAQSWWVDEHDDILPASDFGHIHATMCFPLAAEIPANQIQGSNWNTNVRIVMHHNPSHLYLLRLDNQSGGNVASYPLDQNRDRRCLHETCAFNVPVSLPISKFSSSVLRVRATTETLDGKRFVTSSDWPIKGGNLSEPIQGKGWYASPVDDYAIAQLDPTTIPLGPLSGTYTFRTKTKKASDLLNVALDKSHGAPASGPWKTEEPNTGKVLHNWNEAVTSWRSVTIDTRTLANGWHTIHFRSRNPKGAPSTCDICDNVDDHLHGSLKLWFYVHN